MSRTMPQSLGSVPIVVDLTEPVMCRTDGIYWFKRVVLGKAFFMLPFGIQAAVLEHEKGHIDLKHGEERFWALLWAHLAHPIRVAKIAFIEDERVQAEAWLAFLAERGLLAMARRHEFEADAYAAKRGHSYYLAKLLELTVGEDPGPLHPGAKDRLEALVKAADLTASGIGTITAREIAQGDSP